MALVGMDSHPPGWWGGVDARLPTPVGFRGLPDTPDSAAAAAIEARVLVLGMMHLVLGADNHFAPSTKEASGALP